MTNRSLAFALGAACTASAIVLGMWTTPATAQGGNFVPVTQEMLNNPSPDDWLMFSRTYDAQRFSPLKQINRRNVGQLRLVWSRGIEPGTMEQIPIVYRGVMYFVTPAGGVEALDGTTGDLVWEYTRKFPDDMQKYVGLAVRTKNLAIAEDVILYTAQDGYVVALDARSGKLRWETRAHDYRSGTAHTSGPIVVEGKVVTGRACGNAVTRESGCFIAAHDVRTGREVWKFYTTAAPGEPGGDSWGDLPVEKRIASTWGLPGSYDPVRHLIYWGTSNPFPYTRIKRHDGNPDAVPRFAPSEAYSNSTVALNAETGKLAWYYQHLPGDDWDEDFTHERVLLRTPVAPDPAAVKWINPKIPRGQPRDVTVMVAEGGGLWVNDRLTGEFLWATPFPYDSPYFVVSQIDVETGRTHINWDSVFKKDGERHIICSFNAKSYWPMAYHPGRNALYVQYHDACLDMTAKQDSELGYGPRTGMRRPGSDPNQFSGLAKVNMSTGQIQRIYVSPIPANGAMLATNGDLLFWGDIDRRFRAFDAETGKVLWQTILGGPIQMSTITYAVNGKQYVAVMTGWGQSGTVGPMRDSGMKKPVPHSNAVYVFGLP